MTLPDLADIVRTQRYRFADEYDLQDGLEAAFILAGVSFEREVIVKGGRLDFLVDGELAVEVKVTCPVAQVQRQIKRYIDGGQVKGVLVVAMTPKAANLPREVAGAPVDVVVLAGAGL